jgi:hypothetical protein
MTISIQAPESMGSNEFSSTAWEDRLSELAFNENWGTARS